MQASKSTNWYKMSLNHVKVEFVDIFPTIVDAAEFEPLQLCPEISNTTLLCTEVVLKTNTHMEGGNTEKENNQKDDNLIQSVMFNTTHLFTEVVFNTNMEPHDWESGSGQLRIE